MANTKICHSGDQMMKVLTLAFMFLVVGCRPPDPIHDCRVMLNSLCELNDRCARMSYNDCLIRTALLEDCSTVNFDSSILTRDCSSRLQTLSCDEKIPETCDLR